MDVLVLNYNDAETTKSFLNYIVNYQCVNSVLVVDNCSTDDSYDQLCKLSHFKVHVIRTDKNGGYGYGNNFGIRYLNQRSDSNFILLANPDTIIQEDSLVELETFLLNHSDYGMVAPFMCNSEGIRMVNTAFQVSSLRKIVLSICAFTSKITGGCYYSDILNTDVEYRNVEALSGSLFLMNKEYMIKYGMFDENVFLFCEEIVLGKKFMNSNVKVALLPKIFFIHNHSVSISKTYNSIFKRNMLLMKSREYVFKNYYGVGKFICVLSRILTYVNVVEEYFLQYVKIIN